MNLGDKIYFLVDNKLEAGYIQKIIFEYQSNFVEQDEEWVLKENNKINVQYDVEFINSYGHVQKCYGVTVYPTVADLVGELTGNLIKKTGGL